MYCSPLVAVVLALAFDAWVLCSQMPNIQHSVLETNEAPEWLYLPADVRLTVPAGVRLEVVAIRVVSNDHSRQAALIGVLQNRGRALSGAALALSYIGPDGESVLHSTANAANVSDVPVGATLPFRFPLLSGAALPDGHAGLKITITEDSSRARHQSAAKLASRFSVRAQGQRGFVLLADIETAASQPSPATHGDAAQWFVTFLVVDKKANLLDVLAGNPISSDQLNRYRVEVQSFLPVWRQVRDVRVYAETRETK